MTTEQMEAFLAELAALNIKHGITIDACSCCDHINASEMKPGETGRYKYRHTSSPGGEPNGFGGLTRAYEEWSDIEWEKDK